MEIQPNWPYLGKLTLKFVLTAMAVFTGITISHTHFTDMVTNITRYHSDPLKFLTDCNIVCDRNIKKEQPTTRNKSVILSGGKEYEYDVM